MYENNEDINLLIQNKFVLEPNINNIISLTNNDINIWRLPKVNSKHQIVNIWRYNTSESRKLQVWTGLRTIKINTTISDFLTSIKNNQL